MVITSAAYIQMHFRILFPWQSDLTAPDNCNHDHGSVQQHDIFDIVENPDVLARRRSANFY